MNTRPVSRRRHHRNRNRPDLVLVSDLSEVITHGWHDENQRLLIGGKPVTADPTAPVADLDLVAQARRP